MGRFKGIHEENARIDLRIMCEKLEGLFSDYEESKNPALLGEIRLCLAAYGGFWRGVRDSRSSDEFEGFRTNHKRDGKLVLNGGVSVQSEPGMSYGFRQELV